MQEEKEREKNSNWKKSEVWGKKPKPLHSFVLPSLH